MNKAFRFKNLDCADCAAKLERNLSSIDGINSIRVDFLFQKILLDYDETKKDQVFADMKKNIADFEPDMVVLGL